VIAGIVVSQSPAAAQQTSPIRTPAPQAVLNGFGPYQWNLAIDRERGPGGAAPSWPAVHVLSDHGGESLYVFPGRGQSPMLLGSWPRQEMAAHWVRVFPKYRWIVIETPDEGVSALAASEGGAPRHARFYGTNGSLAWDSRASSVPTALGRDLVLASRPSAIDSIPPRLAVVRLPEGDTRASWPGVTGWGASSQLENFLAVNTVGIFNARTGTRQDELRLLDLEGKILWARTVPADSRDLAVSNFGDVAIARDRQLIVFDRSGGEKFRASLQRNSVGRTAITPDGRFVLVATSSPLAKRSATAAWVGLFDTTKKVPVWSRKNFPFDGTKVVDVMEASVSDDGERALVRLSTGAVLLLGSEGRTLASWNLPCSSRGEYDPGSVPRRTWLSGDGTTIAFTTPVARSLPEARGWLYRVPR
jgi:hypothetical protein